jgi:biopolymer transport protein ExbD
MNVTPMIDVLLVLIIIFMIITPMDPHGLYTAIPQDHGKAAPKDTPIVLQLTQVEEAAPALSINQQKVVWADLKNALLAIYKSRPDGVLFIKGDAALDFEYVAEAIDTAHNANVKRVALIP